MSEIGHSSLDKSVPSTSASPSKYRSGLRFHSAFRILESPNHRATVETNLYRIPDGSEAISPVARELETRWNNRFHVTFSKNNGEAYTANREYFDSPRKFEQGIPKRNNFSPRTKMTRYKKKTGSSVIDRESMWSTRYSASSEWNEVKHKTLRKYFDDKAN